MTGSYAGGGYCRRPLKSYRELLLMRRGAAGAGEEHGFGEPGPRYGGVGPAVCGPLRFRGALGPSRPRGGGEHGFGEPGPRYGGFGPSFGGPFGFGGPRGFRRHGGKARRGDIRTASLLLLAEEPRNGYAIMQAIDERSNGVWRPSPGSVYPALAQLEDEGLIRSEESEGRKQFVITEAGREQIAARPQDAPAPWEI